MGVELDFNRVMRNKEAMEALLAFACLEHSEENLVFYKHATSFRSNYGSSSAKDGDRQRAVMLADATRLVDDFLLSDAKYALNIPAGIQRRYSSGIQSRDVDIAGEPKETLYLAANMFDPAIRAIYSMIREDTFERFRSTHTAQQLLLRVPNLGRRESEPSSAEPTFRSGAAGSADGSKGTFRMLPAPSGSETPSAAKTHVGSATADHPNYVKKFQFAGKLVMEAMGATEEGIRPRRKSITMMWRAAEAFREAGEAAKVRRSNSSVEAVDEEDEGHRTMKKWSVSSTSPTGRDGRDSAADDVHFIGSHRERRRSSTSSLLGLSDLRVSFERRRSRTLTTGLLGNSVLDVAASSSSPSTISQRL